MRVRGRIYRDHVWCVYFSNGSLFIEAGRIGIVIQFTHYRWRKRHDDE